MYNFCGNHHVHFLHLQACITVANIKLGYKVEEAITKLTIRSGCRICLLDDGCSHILEL